MKTKTHEFEFSEIFERYFFRCGTPLRMSEVLFSFFVLFAPKNSSNQIALFHTWIVRICIVHEVDMRHKLTQCFFLSLFFSRQKILPIKSRQSIHGMTSFDYEAINPRLFQEHKKFFQSNRVIPYMDCRDLYSL